MSGRGVLVATMVLATVGAGGFLWYRSRRNADGSSAEPLTDTEVAAEERMAQAEELLPEDDTGDAVPPSEEQLQETLFGDPSILDTPPPPNGWKPGDPVFTQRGDSTATVRRSRGPTTIASSTRTRNGRTITRRERTV